MQFPTQIAFAYIPFKAANQTKGNVISSLGELNLFFSGSNPINLAFHIIWGEENFCAWFHLPWDYPANGNHLLIHFENIRNDDS